MRYQLRALPALCIGFLVAGLGSTLFVYSGLGSDPFNVLAQGIAGRVGTQVGTMNYTLELFLLLGVLVYRRKAIGPGSIIGSVVIGTVMNFYAWLLAPFFQSAGVVMRVCCICAAPLLVGVGVALVQLSDWGLIPCDIVPLLLHERAGRLQYRTVRMLYDLLMLVTGLLLGGTVGLGTVFSALLTGPCIQFALGRLRKWQKTDVLQSAGETWQVVQPTASERRLV